MSATRGSMQPVGGLPAAFGMRVVVVDDPALKENNGGNFKRYRTLLFGSAWAYAFPRLQSDAGSLVKDKIGLARLPGFSPEHQAGCIGGWQVAVTAFSKNKPEAVKFARYLSSPETAKQLAIQAGWLPVFEPLYADEEVLKAQPWFRDTLPALLTGKLRPATPRYGEVSEIIRSNVSAFLAGTKNADAALTDMTKRLGIIFK